MDLLRNPFHILTASPRDNRQRIMELADERSLLLDSSECMEARSELTNPRKRLSAEVAWLPGIGPKRAGEVLSLIESSPTDLLAVDNLSSIARANLLAAGLARLPGHNADDVAEWILEISWAFEDLDPEELMMIINEERVVSGFPEVSDLLAVEAAIQERRRYYRQVVKTALDKLSSKELVRAVTMAVETVTNGGEEQGPILIDDLIDSYEVEAQVFLEREEGNIEILVDKLLAAVDGGQPDSVLSPMVNRLNLIVKNWDTVAQPIQVSAKSRGLDHEASHRVAGLVRSLAIHMYNEHEKLHYSQQITSMLLEVFAEVGVVAERTAQDANVLDNIAENRMRLVVAEELDDIANRIGRILENISKMADEGVSEDSIIHLISEDLSVEISRIRTLYFDGDIENLNKETGNIFYDIRDVSIDLFNEHQLVDSAIMITNLLETLYSKDSELSEVLVNDFDALNEFSNRLSDQNNELDGNYSSKNKKVFDLLGLTKLPTLPAPWSSIDEGETWVWGDYFFTFQKKPKLIFDLAMEMEGKKTEYRGMSYYYAMSVFYRLDMNPHGPSQRPIMTIALEQADLEMVAKMLGAKDSELVLSEESGRMGKPMIGLFIGETHLNYGEYKGGMSRGDVKKRFFEIIGGKLEVPGQPKFIGNIAQAHGHPETGLPAKKKNSGCAPVVLLCIGIGGVGIWGFSYI